MLVAGAQILILDEPTAVLTEGEAQRLLTTARESRNEAPQSSWSRTSSAT